MDLPCEFGRLMGQVQRILASWETIPMRDWMLILAPFAIIFYFLLYPSDFNALIAWLIR